MTQFNCLLRAASEDKISCTSSGGASGRRGESIVVNRLMKGPRAEVGRGALDNLRHADHAPKRARKGSRLTQHHHSHPRPPLDASMACG